MSIALRVEDLESRENIDGMLVTSNPNGVIESVPLMFAMDIINTKLYVCFGGTVWKEISLT